MMGLSLPAGDRNQAVKPTDATVLTRIHRVDARVDIEIKL